MSDRNIQLVRDYFQAVEQGADESELLRFFAPGVRQHEYPNRLVDGGAERDATALLAGRRKGRQVVQNERYVVRSAIASADRVAIELTWTAQLKVPLASTPAGGIMTAHCGVFFRISEGRIVEQHNYDCFDAF